MKVIYKIYILFALFYCKLNGKTTWYLIIYSFVVNLVRCTSYIYLFFNLLYKAEESETNGLDGIYESVEFVANSLNHFVKIFVILWHNKLILQLYHEFQRIYQFYPLAERDLTFLKCLSVFFVIAKNLDVTSISLSIFFTFHLTSFILPELFFIAFIYTVEKMVESMALSYKQSHNVREIRQIRIVYHKLCRLTYEASKVMKLYLFVFLIFTTIRCCLRIYSMQKILIFDQAKKEISKSVPIQNALELFLQILKLLLIVCPCENVARLTELIRAKNVGLLASATGSICREVEQFALQMSLEKIRIYGFGFSLSNKILYVMAITIFSYIFVLLQYQSCY